LYYHFRKNIELGKMPIYLIIGVIGVSMVTYTGHLGGKMAHRDTQGGFNRPGGANGQGGANFQGGQPRPNNQNGQNGQGNSPTPAP
jgi:hypothetical protein